jgi:hypothetical protein
MKTITEIESCMGNTWKVDGKDLAEMSEREIDDFVQYLIIKMQDGFADGTVLLTSLIKIFQYDDFEYDPSSCDGSNISTTTWRI